MRTEAEIKADIEDVKKKIFYEEMADFMDWNAYHILKGSLKILEEELKKVVKE